MIIAMHVTLHAWTLHVLHACGICQTLLLLYIAAAASYTGAFHLFPHSIASYPFHLTWNIVEKRESFKQHILTTLIV